MKCKQTEKKNLRNYVEIQYVSKLQPYMASVIISTALRLQPHVL